MGQAQRDYRAQPLTRMGRAVDFPQLSKQEREDLNPGREDLNPGREDLNSEKIKKAIQQDWSFSDMRNKAHVSTDKRKSWQKLSAEWYDRNYMSVFEGTGQTIAFLAVVSLISVIGYNLGRTLGWWM